MSDTNRSIEDLLLSTLDAVSRFRIGRLEAVSAALDAGSLLTEARGRLPHGEWGDWLVRVKLSPRTASTWMRLAALDITAEDVVASRLRKKGKALSRSVWSLNCLGGIRHVIGQFE